MARVLTDFGSTGCAGHVGTLNFDFAIGQLPVGSGYKFDPNGKLDVTVGTGNGGYIGFIRSHLWDVTNPLPISLVAQLMGGLHDAQMRVDHIPTFTGTWADGASTTFAFAPADPPRFVDGVQVLVSTVAAPLPSAGSLPAADPSADDFLTFESSPTVQRLGGGVFGLQNFSYSSLDASSQMNMHYVANVAHKLIVRVNSRFGGRFFPDFDIDATFTLNKIPATFDIVAEFNPHIQYTGSDGITSITLNGTVDNSGPGLADKTTVAISLTGLPSAVTLAINPASGASLVMNGPLTQLALKLTSNVAILGSDYQLIRGQINNIPAKWNAAWGGNNFLLESKDTLDNPAALGVVRARVSRLIADDLSDARLDPFMTAAVNRIGHSAFQSEIDTLYWPASVNARLDRVYNQGEKLDAGEDHVVVVKNEAGDVAFVDAKFTGFQKILIAPSPAGGDFEFNAPSAGLHPLFGGLQEEKAAPTPDKFTLLQIGNIPDHQELHINIPGRDINYSASGGAGKIDLYQRPVPAAGDGQDVTRIVMTDTPSSVHITWDLGFPNGRADFVSRNSFGIDFLTQDASQRIVTGAQLKSLHIGYGIDLFPFNTAETLDIDVPCPIPPDFICTLASVPVAWDLVRASASFTADPDIDGYFGLYGFEGGLSDLASTTAPDGNEYVPTATGLVRNFSLFSISVALTLDPLTPNLFFPISLDVTGPTITGQFVIDVWSSDDTIKVFTIPLVDYDIGFINHPDYIDNSPLHIIPIETFGVFIDHDAVFSFNGFHGFGAHFDPFGP